MVKQVQKSCNSVLNCGTSTNNSGSQTNPSSPTAEIIISFEKLSDIKKDAVICYAIISACIPMDEIDEEEYKKLKNQEDCEVSKIKFLKRETIKYLSDKSKCLDILQEKYYKRLEDGTDDASDKFKELTASENIDFINNILIPAAWLSLTEPTSSVIPNIQSSDEQEDILNEFENYEIDKLTTL
jgi:hypothetical protein